MAKSRRRGCLGLSGCGLLLAVLLVVGLIWAALVPFRLLRRIGLQQSAAERLLANTPDRQAAQVLKDRLQVSDLPAGAVQVHVLELGNTGERVAFTVLDASKGFEVLGDLKLGDEAEEADNALSSIAQLTDGLDIDRIAIHYVGEDGKPLITLTHRVEDILALEQGKMDETEFLEGLGVNFDLLKVLGEVRP